MIIHQGALKSAIINFLDVDTRLSTTIVFVRFIILHINGSKIRIIYLLEIPLNTENESVD